MLNWHCVFLVNGPIGTAALVLARRYVKGGGGIGLRECADPDARVSFAVAAVLLASRR